MKNNKEATLKKWEKLLDEMGLSGTSTTKINIAQMMESEASKLLKEDMNKETKFKVGDKAHKTKGYKFPCTIVGVFETIKGDIRVVGEMDEYGLLHIFNEDQLEHVKQK